MGSPYLTQDQFREPKEIFKLLIKLLKQSGSAERPLSVIDIGCANGALIYWLKKEFPTFRFQGMDMDRRFLDVSQKIPELNGVPFIQTDFLSYAGKETYDIVLFFGILGFFDEFHIPMERLLRLSKKGARIFMHCSFNDYDIDVRVLQRDNAHGGQWEAGLNSFSKGTAERYLKGKVQSFSFHEFIMGKDLKMDPLNPIRIWTTRLASGEKVFMNGLNFVRRQQILEIVV